MAQNSDLPIPCCSVSANSVQNDARADWCDAQRNSCVVLCGGQGQIGANGNTCDQNTLDYACECRNGTDISSAMSVYKETVPALMCLTWYDDCINAAASDAAGQFACTQARDESCGNQDLPMGEGITSETVSSSRLSSSTSSSSPRTSNSSDASSTSTSSSTPSSSDGSITNSVSSPTASGSVSQPEDEGGSGGMGLSGGAIAGIVVGVVGGLIIVAILAFFCYRRRKRAKVESYPNDAGDHRYDDKQVATAIATDISNKPELDATGVLASSKRPEAMDGNGYTDPHVYHSESQSQRPSELYTPQPHHHTSELYAPVYHNPAELPSPPHQSGIESNAPPHISPTQSYQYQPPPSIEPYQSAPIDTSYQHQSPPPPSELSHERYNNTSSPAPPIYPTQPPRTQAEIAALEEEERRIDAEMEEVRRMKELRDQKYEIQRKLREAKSG